MKALEVTDLEHDRQFTHITGHSMVTNYLGACQQTRSCILLILRARSKVSVDAGCNTVGMRNLVANTRGLRLKPEIIFLISKVKTK